MTKGILIKAPDLFTVDEQLEIQERLKSNDIEVAFLRDDQIQASFYSFIEILVNNDFLNELEELPVYIDILDEAENFYYGLGDSLQDYSEALKLYKHAIKLGGIEAYSRIGQMYIEGEGCIADARQNSSPPLTCG